MLNVLLFNSYFIFTLSAVQTAKRIPLGLQATEEIFYIPS